MEEHPSAADPTNVHRPFKTVGIRLILWFGVFAATISSACAIGSWAGDSTAANVAKNVAVIAAAAASVVLFGVLMTELQNCMRAGQYAFVAGVTLVTLIFGAALSEGVAIVFLPGISGGVGELLYLCDFGFLLAVGVLLASHLVPFVKTVGIVAGAGMISALLFAFYFLANCFWEHEIPWDRKACESVVQMIESGKLVEENDRSGTVLLPPPLSEATGIYQVYVTHLPAGRVYFFQTCYRHGGFRRGYVYSAVPYEKLYVQKDNAGNDNTMINVGMEEFPLEMIIQPTRWAEWFHTPGSAEMNEHPRQTWQPSVPGLDVSFDLHRLGGGYVEASVMVTHNTGTPTPAIRVRVFEVNAKQKPLVEVRTGDNVAGQSKNAEEIETTDNKSKIQFIHEMIELKQGSEVQAELQAGQKSELSPIFKPE